MDTKVFLVAAGIAGFLLLNRKAGTKDVTPAGTTPKHVDKVKLGVLAAGSANGRDVYSGQVFKVSVSGTYAGPPQTLGFIVVGVSDPADIDSDAEIEALVTNPAVRHVWTVDFPLTTTPTAFTTQSPDITMPILAADARLSIALRIRSDSERTDWYFRANDLINARRSTVGGISIQGFK